MSKKINKKTKKAVFLITIIGLFVVSAFFITSNFKKAEDIPSVELTLNSFSPNGSMGGVMIPASCESGYYGHEVCPGCACSSSTCIGSTCTGTADTWGVSPVCPGTKCCPNNCAASTCSSTTCWTGCSRVTGSVCCPNNCAASTCSSTTCWTGCATVQGTLACNNHCEFSISVCATCWNNIAWVQGTVACSAPNYCSGTSCVNNCASTTSVCATCWNGVAQVPGTVACTAPDVCSGGFCVSNPTLAFSASPNPIAYNAAATLTWTTTSATSCWATGNWTGWQTATGGSVSTGALTASGTYSLECWNSLGISSGIKSVSVCVSNCDEAGSHCVGIPYSGNCGQTCTGTLPQNCPGSWGSCSKSCGGGIQTKACNCPSENQTQICNSQPCPPGYREVSPW